VLYYQGNGKPIQQHFHMGKKKWRGGGNVTNAEGINLQGETSV